MSDTTWTPAAIRSLRRMTGENAATFGRRFGRSARTIEDWEQGRHRPDALACKALTARARRVLTARAKLAAAGSA